MKKIITIILVLITTAMISQNYPAPYSIDNTYKTNDPNIFMLKSTWGTAYINGTDTILLKNIIMFDSTEQTSYLRGVWLIDTNPEENYIFVFAHTKYQFRRVNQNTRAYVPARNIHWFEVINELKSIKKNGKIYTPAFPGCETYFQQSMIGFKSIDAAWFTF